MKMIGYARASTTDQDLAAQLAALKGAGCDVTYKEKPPGTTTRSGRTMLHSILHLLRGVKRW